MAVPGEMVEVGLVSGEQNGHCSRRYRPCHMRSDALDASRLNADLVVLDDEYGARARPVTAVDRPTAHLVIADHTTAPPAELVRSWVAVLGDRGFEHVRTGALADEPRRAFEEAGFEVHQQLVLLRIDPTDVTDRGRRRRGDRIRSARTTSDLTAATAIDRAAFGVEWSIDDAGILDACSATPSHRMRMIGDVAYAVTGRAQDTGFLQRLAVHPDAQGRGHGRRLVVDSLDWLRRWRVRTAMVNTHVDNLAALGLYESIGFDRLRDRLVVMGRAVEGS